MNVTIGYPDPSGCWVGGDVAPLPARAVVARSAKVIDIGTATHEYRAGATEHGQTAKDRGEGHRVDLHQ